MPDEKLAAEIGLRPVTVTQKRQELQIPPPVPNPRYWPPHEVALLGKSTDLEVARKVGRSRLAVEKKRRKLGIPPLPQPSPWTKRALAQLGKVPDEEIAAEIGVVVWAVARMRRKLGKPPVKRHRRRTRLLS
ncbi:MAG: hypothetical protein GY856_25155 [bacterium]|nr:hypothetical protein [bacterium]